MHTVNTDNLKRFKQFSLIYFLIPAIILVVLLVLFLVPPSGSLNSHSENSFIAYLVFSLVSLISIVVGVININKYNRTLAKIRQLQKTGKLVKNLPYRLENTHIRFLVYLKKPVVDYTLPSGKTITLSGHPRFDEKTTSNRKTIDLLIDEANPDNYYLEFDIT